ncbi:MAG: lipoprotein insertase outer membrane protein LolB [Methylococcales bacterium]|nr:lipoprotein insertase outer membrane protein LolB [Methylococcales bacterium]
MQTNQVFVRYLGSAALLLMLAGCSVTPELPQEGYGAVSKQHLSQLTQWKLDGRMSITSPDDSWSANVEWQRRAGEDSIQLSGPLGQGAVIIHLGAKEVSIDDGDGRLQHSSDPDLFVKERLGVFVPVRALSYWVIGLPDPSREVRYTAQGFEQENWQIEYKEWQSIAGRSMPRKVTVVNDKVKLKLVCDQWVIG